MCSSMSVKPDERRSVRAQAGHVRANGRRRSRRLLAFAAAALAINSLAMGVDRHWDGGAATTNWFDRFNWTGDQFPQSEDDATIGCDIHARSATVDIWSGDAGCGELRLADYEATNVNVLNIRGGTLTNYTHGTGDQHIAGYEGTGTINLMGGTHRIYGGVLLGHKAGSSGTYRISSGYLDLTWGTSVSRGSGASTFIMDGGSIGFGTGSRIEANDVYIGQAASSNASLSLGTTNRIIANNLYIGFNGTGTLTQNTGSGYDVSVATQLRLGESVAGTGTYNLTGGKLSVTGHEYLGLYGNGIFTQTGGTNELSQSLWLGYYGSGGGIYSLRGGNLNFTSTGKYIYVGYGGTGRFEWYGGTITAPGGGKPTMQFPVATRAGTLAMGWSFDVATLAAGGYIPVPGLDQSTLEITNGATATQNTGSWSIYQLQIGGTDGNGIYNFNAGTGNVTWKLWIGRGTGRTGTLNMQGGAATVNTCRMADDANSVGILNLASGSFTVGSSGSITTGGGTSYLYLDGGSLALQAATKTIAVTNLSVGQSAGSAVSYEFGSGYTISSTSQYVGVSRNATLILSGNAGDITSGMVLGSGAGASGTLKLRGSSSLSAASIAKGAGEGHVYLDGGSLTLTGAKSINVTTLGVGMETGSNPSWTIADGYSVMANTGIVGNAVSASLSQTGGSTTVGTMTVGVDAGVAGTFTISGGSMAASSGIALAQKPGSTGTLKLRGGMLATPGISAGGGTGNVYLDGGTLNTVGGSIQIGATNLYVGGEQAGTYAFGSGWKVTAANEYIGHGADGSLTQLAGADHTAGTIRLAHGNVAGTLALNGGSLTVGAITSGSGTSTLILNDASLTFTGARSISVTAFKLGDTPGPNIAFALDAPADILSAAQQTIGSARTAAVVQSAGTNIVGALLQLGGTAASSSSYELSGGLVSGPAAQLIIGTALGGMGRFAMSGSSTAIFDKVSIVTGVFEQADQSSLRVNRLEGFGDNPVFGANLTLGHSGGSGSGSHVVGPGQSLAVAGNLTLGHTAAATLKQTGGEVSAANLYFGDTPAGNGTYQLDDGTLNIAGRIATRFGWGGLVVNAGAINFTSGPCDISVSSFAVGDRGAGTFAMGDDPADRLAAGLIAVGRRGTGRFIQTGGVVDVKQSVTIGQFGGDGRYEIRGGAVLSQSPAAQLIVGSDASSVGAVEGYGAILMTGTLVNNGRVVADGRGSDANLLDMSRFAAVVNLINNAQEKGDKGWYATDHGMLLLPPVRVEGPGVYYWGESPSGPGGDADIDLVNSVQLRFTSIDQPGDLRISLLAPDRGDSMLPSAARVVGLWDFGFSVPMPSFTVDLAFRYDDALAAHLGVEERALSLYRWSDGSWSLIPSYLDIDRNLIFADGVTSFSLWAVGVEVPSPSAVPAGLLLLAAALCRRTRRGR